eukprot:CAMPEP_0170543464 /NCGR_PEP_ID=MMETSP0211-20121228/2565_1 /TAXON_ID=311385 /ORGANISM="Pseudokeronopsis sp., Strain OXSARD2" /LENGTH=116 /DNA_ID=CAMNT_0010846843 /DNA_START=478 /DNA_END=828 /DNA_ORIENTATION=+
MILELLQMLTVVAEEELVIFDGVLSSLKLPEVYPLKELVLLDLFQARPCFSSRLVAKSFKGVHFEKVLYEVFGRFIDFCWELHLQVQDVLEEFVIVATAERRVPYQHLVDNTAQTP